MDWMVIVFPVLAVVISLAAILTRRSKPKTEEEFFVERWELPAPGGDFKLYRRVKKLLDDLEAERDEARLEREIARHAYEAALEEQNRLAAKLDLAQEMLRSWTHPKMKIDVRERPRKDSRRLYAFL